MTFIIRFCSLLGVLDLQAIVAWEEEEGGGSEPGREGRRPPTFRSKVDGCVPQTQHVNLRIVGQPEEGEGS